jgi:hypothetical protein
MSWFTRLLGGRPRATVSLPRPAVRLGIEALEQRQVPTVQYFGGNLLPHVEAQALYYGNEWSAAPNNAQTATLDAFLHDLTGGAYLQALTRAGYNVGTGTASAGAVDHTALAAGSTITDASIRARLQTGINQGLLQAPDANRLYVVYVEPNVAVNLGAGKGSTTQGVLGYHGAFAGTDANGKPATIRYAVVAYPGGTVGNSSLGTAAVDQLTAVTSHEVAEAVTDPDVNFAQLGWYDSRRGEIGDITANNPNALVRLDGYLVQEVADRNDQLLALNVAPPTVSPPPTLPPATAVATTTTLQGTVNRRSSVPSVTFTAIVSPSVQPGSTVELLYNNHVAAVGQVRLVNGVAEASFTVFFHAPGSYSFTASFRGTGPYQGSTSSSVTVTVA